MKFCSNCGKQLDDTATVCDACGTPTTQLPVPAPSSAPSPVKENPALGIVALILSIIGFLTGILTIGTYLDLLAILCSLFLLWKSQEKSLKTNLSVAALVTASLSALTCIFILNQKLAILFCVLLLIAIFLFKYKKIQKLQEKQRFLILAAVLIVLSISACGVLTKAAVSAHNNIPASTSETKETSGQEESAKDMLKAVKRFYREKSYSAAIAHAEKLIEAYPDTPQAEKAKEILEKSKPLYAQELRKKLEEAIKKEDWDSVATLGETLQSDKYAEYDAAKGIDEVLANAHAESKYKIISEAQKNKSWESVLKQSQDFLKDWPNSPRLKEVQAMQDNAKAVYWDALQAAQKEKNWGEALSNAKFLQTYFPKDAEIQSALDSINGKIKERRTQLLASFISERDEVQDLTWYTPASAPKYINQRCAIYPYLAKSDSGKVTMRLKVIYFGDSWLFLRGVIFDIDDETYPLSYSQGEYFRDNNWDVWEVIDKEVSDTDKVLLREIANSKTTVIRFQGSQYYHDMTVSQAEKQGIQDTLELAKYL